MPRQWRRITPEKRREVIKLAAKGHSAEAIAQRLELGARSIQIHLRPLGGVYRQAMWQPSERRLSMDERVGIRLGLERGESIRAIARRLGRAPSTISREVRNNGSRSSYGPMAAHRRAELKARRPKPTKLRATPELRRRVITDLKNLWSPEQISIRLGKEFGDDPCMQISPEAIYRSLYVQGRGELRRELAACLRTGRATRRPQGRLETRGRIPDMVMISDRPAQVGDRAVPGHWEGDLLMGKEGKSAIGTLVERSTRFVMLFPLPRGRSAELVRVAMAEKIQTLPQALRRSITWDQGREMAQHARFKIDTGIDIYFCDPHSPWQRGSNENTNGLLRQYFPKGMDLSKVPADRIQAAADSLNGRPRKTLDAYTPAEKLAELVALTE